MAKEYNWDVTIDGVARRVCCVPSGNKYVLYLDEEHLINVYRLSNRGMRFGLEAPVSICGKDCLFIVWDEQPDLVVDGILIGRQTEYQQARAGRKKESQRVYRILFWAGVLWTAVFSVLAFTAEIDWMAPNRWFSTIGAGVIMMMVGVLFGRKWERW